MNPFILKTGRFPFRYSTRAKRSVLREATSRVSGSFSGILPTILLYRLAISARLLSCMFEGMYGLDDRKLTAVSLRGTPSIPKRVETNPICNLENVSDTEHIKFWIDPARYEVLREGFKILSDENWASTRFEKIGKNVVGEFMPHHKALARFRKNRNSIKGQPSKLTGLLVTCGYLFANNRNIRNDSRLRPLMELAADVSREMDIGQLAEVVLGESKSYSGGKYYERAILEGMHNSIDVPTGHDPRTPEFPPFSPHFPATSTFEITIDGRRVFIKDESENPTGSHKDRMAWEIVVRYKEIARRELQAAGAGPFMLPHFSIISSGSAALAIQAQLKQRRLPHLKVLMDEARSDPKVVNLLTSIGAEVILHDLDKEELSQTRVLEITRNLGGADVTTRDITRPVEWRYYDWLAYEVLREEPKHIFCPFGTGDLFCNIARIIADQARSAVTDQRLEKGKRSVTNVSIYGAAASSSGTSMDKLYARFNPTRKPAEELVRGLVSNRIVGQNSGIYDIDDDLVSDTFKLARDQRINTEPSGIAGLALCRKLMKSIPEDQKILVINTGWLYLPKYIM